MPRVRITPQQARAMFPGMEPEITAGQVLQHVKGAYNYAPRDAHLQVAYGYAMRNPLVRQTFEMASDEEKKYLLGRLNRHVDDVRKEYGRLYKVTATAYGARQIAAHGAAFSESVLGNKIGGAITGAAGKVARLRLLHPAVLATYYLLKTRSPKAAAKEAASRVVDKYVPDVVPGPEARILQGTNDYIPIRAAKRFINDIKRLGKKKMKQERQRMWQDIAEDRHPAPQEQYERLHSSDSLEQSFAA